MKLKLRFKEWQPDTKRVSPHRATASFGIVTWPPFVCSTTRTRCAHVVTTTPRPLRLARPLTMEEFYTPILANALSFAFEKATMEGKITIGMLAICSLVSFFCCTIFW